MMKNKDQIESLERRVEDMLYSHRNERTSSMTIITALVSQLVETNKQLINQDRLQMNEIALIRAENHHLRELVKLESTLT